MTEKTFNARLKLKYDTHEQWIANDPVLLQGEVALSVVSVKQDGTVNEVPSVLMKVGDGTHKYSELGFTYAKAADVIAAAKSADALTAFIKNVINNSGIATNEALTALSGRVTTAESDIDALQTKVGDKAVATQITEAIDALNLSETYATKSHTHTKSEITDFEHTHAIADVTGLQNALDANAAAIEAHKTAIDAKVTTLIGSDTDKSVRTIANEELAAQLIPEGAKESLDTLQEIAAWIQDHPDDASAMNTAIEALQAKVGDSSVSAQITAAINELKAGDIKNAVDRIAALEGKSHEHANKALLDTYTQTEANLADAVAKKHSHANKTELDKFATGDKAKLDSAVQTVTAGTGLKVTKTGTNVSIDFDDSVTFVFNCGSSVLD